MSTDIKVDDVIQGYELVERLVADLPIQRLTPDRPVEPDRSGVWFP